jgi:potassium inwardly-rectifying channel subfamily J
LDILGAHARGVLVKSTTTLEGETDPHDFRDLDFEFETGSNTFHIWWPQKLVHKIDENSPLWNVQPETLSQSSFEIIFILEGYVGCNAMDFQARTSFRSHEIIWGQGFTSLVEPMEYTGRHHVNLRYLDSTVPVYYPLKISDNNIRQVKRSQLDTNSRSTQTNRNHVVG